MARTKPRQADKSPRTITSSMAALVRSRPATSVRWRCAINGASSSGGRTSSRNFIDFMVRAGGSRQCHRSYPIRRLQIGGFRPGPVFHVAPAVFRKAAIGRRRTKRRSLWSGGVRSLHRRAARRAPLSITRTEAAVSFPSLSASLQGPHSRPLQQLAAHHLSGSSPNSRSIQRGRA